MVNNIGLSDSDGEIKWKFRTSRRIYNTEVEQKEQTIKLLTLYEYIISNNVTGVDFIKIDIDWYEFKSKYGEEIEKNFLYNLLLML